VAQLMVRNLPEDLVKALKQRAAKNNRSAEQEHREISPGRAPWAAEALAGRCFGINAQRRQGRGLCPPLTSVEQAASASGWRL